MSLGRQLRLARPRRLMVRRYRASRDVWEASEFDLPPETLGAPPRPQLARFLDGDQGVRPTSVSEVCAWLSGCAYVSDPDLFQLRDHWQHPDDFERCRRGDCEDHALWAWRALGRIGVHAELMVGEWIPAGLEGGGMHAWVVYHDAGHPWVLESVYKHAHLMARPLSQARAEYEPHYSIDTTLRTRIYAGYGKYALVGSEFERARRIRGVHGERLESLTGADFGIRRLPKWVLALLLLLTIIPFGGFVTLASLALLRTFGSPWGTFGVAAIALVYLLISGWLLGVDGYPRRLTFDDEGVRLRGVFGERAVRWASVRRAVLTSNKGSVTLSLWPPRGRALRIPLSQFERSASLYRAIERRIPVHVERAGYLARQLRDG